MAKQGMKRPEYTHTQPKNQLPPVPELQGAAKHGHKKANPIVAGTVAPAQKVYHSRPHTEAYAIMDNDLAAKNLTQDIPQADLQDL